MGWWRQQGVFRDELIGGVYTAVDFTKRGLPVDHGIGLRVSPDGQCVWLWRSTVSGWVLGIALVARDGSFLEWLYAGAGSPDRLAAGGRSHVGRGLRNTDRPDRVTDPGGQAP